MKKIIQPFPEILPMNQELSSYFSGCKIGVLDIETTGLSPFRNKVILGGLISYEPSGQGVLQQYFAENPSEEPLLIETYLHAIKDLDVLISYNGRGFDLPFVEARAKALNIPFPGWPYHLDLYLLIQKSSDLRRRLPNLKQKTVEDYLGLWMHREDRISGGESVSLYEEYLMSGEKTLVEKVLLHNQDDLKQLSRLLKITEKCNLAQGLFHLGFPVSPELFVTRILFRSHSLEVEGIQHRNSIGYYSFGNMNQSVKIAFDGTENKFQLAFPLFRKAQGLFVDLFSLGLPQETFENQEGFESGFLILREKENTNYPLINQLIRQLVQKIRKEMEEQ